MIRFKFHRPLRFPKVIIRDGAGHYLQLPSLTTTQRNALTAVAGMLIYNSTTAQVEVYDNGSWQVTGKKYGDATFLPLAGGTMTGPINYGSQGNSGAYQTMRDLLRQGVPIDLAGDMAQWSNVVDGTGSLVVSSSIVSARTGATANSTCVGYRNIIAARELANSTRINWAKKLLWTFDLEVAVPTANTFGYVMIYEQDTPAVGDCVDPTAKAIGIKIANLALTGVTFDTEIASVNLSTNLVNSQYKRVAILHIPGDKVYWFVSDLLTTAVGSSAREPAGQAGAYTRVAVMADNGATEADFEVEMTNSWIWQEP